jgi:hypothetical protein
MASTITYLPLDLQLIQVLPWTEYEPSPGDEGAETHPEVALCSFCAQLHLTPAYSSQSSYFAQTLAGVGLSESE